MEGCNPYLRKTGTRLRWSDGAAQDGAARLLVRSTPTWSDTAWVYARHELATTNAQDPRHRDVSADGVRELIGRVTGGTPPSSLTGALLERVEELEALEAALGNAEMGQGGIVIVEAATGLGKSRLLDEAAALAADRGARVLSACGRDLEHDLPFGVALQLFEKPVADFDDPERERFFSGSAGLAASLVLEGRPAAEGLPASLHGLYWLSANLAEDRPLMLSIDDVHWCDPPTMRFLVYLAERIQELPITLVLAVAAGHPPVPDPLLDELRAHRATTVLRPQPLSSAAVMRGLSDSVLPDVEPLFARACHRATGGNPLLLGELAVELAMREVEPYDDNAGAVHELAPESLAAAVLVRLRRLGEGAPELARAVAVLGDGAHLRHAAALAELPVERAVQLADSLMGAGVLRREQRLSFVHSVVQVAIDAERPELERAEAHRRAAALLMAEGAPVERLAPHLLAGRPDRDPNAVEILLEAGERALAGGAPDSAMRLLRRALEEPPSRERRADVLVALGRAEGAAGAPGAIERLTGALDLIGEPSGRAAAALDAGRLLMSHARWEDAADTLERGIEDVRRDRLRPARPARGRLRGGFRGGAGARGDEPARRARGQDARVDRRRAADPGSGRRRSRHARHLRGRGALARHTRAGRRRPARGRDERRHRLLHRGLRAGRGRGPPDRRAGRRHGGRGRAAARLRPGLRHRLPLPLVRGAAARTHPGRRGRLRQHARRTGLRLAALARLGGGRPGRVPHRGRRGRRRRRASSRTCSTRRGWPETQARTDSWAPAAMCGCCSCRPRPRWRTWSRRAAC